MKKLLLSILILSLLFTTVIFAAPGDTSDPIVVLSYLNDRLNSLVTQFELDKIKTLEAKVEALSTTSQNSQALEVVEIRNGEKIICGAGTELILRGGEAIIIGSNLGGLANVTLANDFTSGMKVVPNNLMIVPRNDGRGVYTENYAIFMVRGKYEVIK